MNTDTITTTGAANAPGTADVERLAALEGIIETGMQTFIEVGEALLEIRNDRLYREQGFATFESYCRERWQWSKSHVNRQIQAAQVVQNLTPIGAKPQNEAQAQGTGAAAG